MANTPRPGGPWVDGVTPITADQLNRIEGNTADAASRLTTLEAAPDGVSEQELTDAVAAASTLDRDRGNHTGTQDAATITGLADVATSGAYSDLTGTPAIPTAYSDLTGTVPTAALPALAISDTFPVASQSAMLALTAQRGDFAIRTDLTPNRTFILTTDSPSTLADWKEILAAGQVTSVAGKSGAVSLVKGDVGLGNVDNTSDANKPISTATQTALDAKAPTSRAITAGTGLTGGGTLAADRTLAVSYGTASGTAVQGNDARVTADQAAGTASIRTLGTGALQAAAGDHGHPATAITSGTFDPARFPRVFHGGVSTATMTGGQSLNVNASSLTYATVLRLTLTTATTANTLNVPTGTPLDGQVYKIHAVASGGTRNFQFAAGYRISTGVTRGPYSIASGEVFIGAIEYSELIGSWVIVAGTVSAT